VVEALTETALGGQVNEDSVGHSPHGVWVIDGGTSSLHPRLDPTSDARWLADHLSRALADRFRSSPADPADALRQAIEDTAGAAGNAFEGGTPPSAAVTVLSLGRRRPAMAEYASLGDVSLLFWSPGSSGVEMLRAPGRSDAELRFTRQYQELRSRGVPRAEAQRLILQEVERRRASRMNREGGYWIASIDPRAADFAQRGSVACQPGSRFLVASDGFATAQETFGPIASWADILRGTAPLHDVVAGIRAAERADPDCVSHPRLKPSDDASAVLVEVSED
jgi:hypothetical protein